MSNIIVTSDVDEIMQAADFAEIRGLLGIGTESNVLRPVAANTNSLGDAILAATYLSPSVTNPIAILLEPGVYTQTSDASLAVAYVNVIGSGINATTVNWESSSCLSMDAENISVTDLELKRSGSGNAKVLHSTVSTLAGWKLNQRLERVRVVNIAPTGVAIGTLVARCKNIETEATHKGIDWLYGGTLSNCFITAEHYAIYDAQACAVNESNPPQEDYVVQIEGGIIRQTDPTAGYWAIRGLKANENGVRVDGGGVIVVGVGPSWQGTQLTGVKIYSAAADDGDAAAESEMVNGNLHMNGCFLTGDRITTYIDSSYWSGCYLSCQHSGADELISGMYGSYVTGGSFITSNTKQVVFMDLCRWASVSFESAPYVIFGHCNNLIAPTCTYGAVNGTFSLDGMVGGLEGDKALLVPDDADSYAQVLPSTVAPTTDFNSATSTVEMWVKLPSTTTNTGLICFTDATGRHGFYMYCQRGTTTLRGGFNTASGTELLSTTCSTLFADNTSSGPFGDGWHHIAITLSGGTHKLWLDGVEKDSDTGATSIGSGRLIVGGFSDTPTTGGMDGFTGQGAMFGSIRISNSLRTLTATNLAKDWVADSNTVALWNGRTKGNLTLRDELGRHDLHLLTLQNTYPYFVHRGYTP